MYRDNDRSSVMLVALRNTARFRILLASLALWLAQGSAASSGPPSELPPGKAPDIVGEALDPETGRTLYFEHHYCSEDALSCSVFYLRPDEQVFATKQLDYEPSLKAPALVFRDYRNDREQSIAQPGDDQVVDAGFDNFVRLQWSDLAGGEEVRFPFRMVGRDDPVKMRANRESQCEPGRLCLQIRLDSWLLGSLVDPIQLTYDESSQRLLRFTGISNLKNDQGRSQKVDIRYRYSDDTSAADAGNASAGPSGADDSNR